MIAPPLFPLATTENETMEDVLHVPKLHLAAFPSSLPKYLAPIGPPTYPFTSPDWCMQHKPRAISILDVYKAHELLMTYTVDQKPIYLIGRNAVVCDIVFNHCSISRLHAAIIHHKDSAAYVIDLGSCHGTFVDDVRLRPLQPTLLLDGSMLKFGASSRSYTFKSFESQEQIAEIVHSRLGLEPEEMQLQQNTMMNKALSYRLGFSIPIKSGNSSDSNDEEDDPMNACSRRQMESSSSLPRRSQSEDNVIAAGVQLRLHGAVSGVGSTLQEQKRKRTRTQSAGVPTTHYPLSSSDASTSRASCQQDSPAGPNVISKRVHFSQQAPSVIPNPYMFEEGGNTGGEDEATIVTPRNLSAPASAVVSERFADDDDVLVETPRD